MIIIGHCRVQRHEYCGGGELDRGDGTWVACTCFCHDVRCVECHGPLVKDEGERCGECLSQMAGYYHEEGGQG